MKPFTSTIALDSIEIASPCHADWNKMKGDDTSRFCKSCQKNVYNLSSMTKSDAEALLLEKEGRVCVRFYLREDGTMLTQDCPVGIQIDARLQPRFAMWSRVCALTLVAGAILTGALQISNAEASSTKPAPTMGEAPMMMGAPLPPPASSTKKVRPLMGRVSPSVRMGKPKAPTPTKKAAKKSVKKVRK